MPVVAYTAANGLDNSAAALGVKTTVFENYTALLALTSTQKDKVWADYMTRYTLDDGIGAPANLVAMILLNSGLVGLLLVASALLIGYNFKMGMVANYIRGNPTYLVAPPFDPTINVPGYKAVSPSSSSVA